YSAIPGQRPLHSFPTRRSSDLAYPAAEHEKDIQIADADIQAWYDKNKQSLELPEQVSADYLLLDEAAAMANLPQISDDELRKYRSEEHTSELQSRENLVCRLLL